jgi:hypothetical protein
LRRLSASLVPESQPWRTTSAAELFRELTDMVERDRSAVGDVEINPAVWQHTDIQPSEADRRCLAQAVTKLATDLAPNPD